MGVYDNVTITTGDRDARLDSLATYLNGLDGITAEVYIDEDWDVSYDTHPHGVLFSFDGTSIQGFYGYFRDLNYNAIWLKNGNEWLIPHTIYDPYYSATNLMAHVYIDEHCSIIAIKDTMNDRAGLEVMLLTIGSKKLVGYKYWSGSQTFYDISSMTFEDIEDTIRVLYSYTNMFPYSAPAGQLDFINQAYFVNGNNVKKFTTEFLKECSAVNLLSSASLPAPLGNFIAIGAHCLAPLDEEGGN